VTSRRPKYELVQTWILDQLSKQQSVTATQAELEREAQRIEAKARRALKALHAVRDDDARDEEGRICR